MKPGDLRRDAAIWTEETRRFLIEGDAIFNDAIRLGSTIAMSCDMCHPNAANTHPETYRKHQVQVPRVALLRDRISGCQKNSLKTPALADDDPKMCALEAYILAQREGVSLENGKHGSTPIVPLPPGGSDRDLPESRAGIQPIVDRNRKNSDSLQVGSAHSPCLRYNAQP